MNWFQVVALVVGVLDAALVLLGGAYAAFLISTKGSIDDQTQRMGAAAGFVIASNVGALIILWMVWRVTAGP